MIKHVVAVAALVAVAGLPVAHAQAPAKAPAPAKGAPAESSMSTFQRLSSAATRRASSRSGVTSAAVRPSSFSVSRSARATTSAS